MRRPSGAAGRSTRGAVAIESDPAIGATPTTQGTDPAIRLEGVVKRFGEVVAVDGIDLDIADGEFFSMLGPSGSGKTTTLRMIAGFEEPTEGHIRLHGRDITGVPPFDRDVNTVFQDYALFPHMSVGDNIGYGLVVSGVPGGERRTRVAEAMRMVRLDGYEARRPESALGRPAPARCPGTRARQPAAGAPARRAARRARPQAPRGDADRAESDPGTGRHHLRLRHPRPGGGAHHEQSPGRLQPGQDRAGRFAGRRLRASGDDVRRRLRWHVEPAERRDSARSHRHATASSPFGPRRSGLPSPTRQPDDDEGSALGTIREIVYLGPDTRYIVALETGGELVVTQQNLQTSSMEALAAQGRAVRLVWKRHHVLSLANERGIDGGHGGRDKLHEAPAHSGRSRSRSAS